jgi:hypothetical protein
MEYTRIAVLGTGCGAMVRQGRFEIPAVPVGHHRVQARFVGYMPQTLDVVVRENHVSLATFRLEQYRGPDMPTIEMDKNGIVRIDGVLITHSTCPDSVVVTFQLLHDEVRADHDFECLVRIQNAGSHTVRVPRDLRRFISVSYIYPNGNEDDYNPEEKMEETSMGRTRLLEPGRSIETRLTFPGRGLPGRYTFQLVLWRPTKAWLWREPAWFQHDCRSFESSRWTVTVLP